MKKLDDVNFVLFFLIFVSVATALINYQNVTAAEELRLKEVALQQNIEDYCNDFNNQIEYGFNSSSKNLLFFFKDIPAEEGIEEINLLIDVINEPMLSSLGHNYHFETPIELDTSNKVHQLNHPFFVPRNTYLGFDTVTFSADMSLKFVNNKKCSSQIIKKLVVPIEDSNARNFLDITQSIIPPWYFDNFTTLKSQEMETVYETLIDVANNINNSLKPPSKDALFLALHDWDKETASWNKIQLNRPLSDIKLGFFGNFSDLELGTVVLAIEMIRAVAPQLKISFATQQEDVTLYIHKSACSSQLNYKDCAFVGGLYYSSFFEDKLKPNHGYIWLKDEEYLSADNVASSLVHELGHALGLNHNNCFDSLMNTEFGNDDYEYFQPIDLAVLHAIYNNDYLFQNANNLDSDLVEMSEGNTDEDFTEILEHGIAWVACNLYLYDFDMAYVDIAAATEELAEYIQNN